MSPRTVSRIGIDQARALFAATGNGPSALEVTGIRDAAASGARNSVGSLGRTGLARIPLKQRVS
jgi:hypothetical protein